jgi:hypothetical protein
MNGIMKSIESCHGAPCILKKDLILNDEFDNLTFLRFNFASDTVFMSKISKIRFQKGHGFKELIGWAQLVSLVSLVCLVCLDTLFTS